MPYLKYLTQKSGYTRGKVKVIDDMPENYIDYLLIDIEALRVGELNMFNNGGIYTLEINPPSAPTLKPSGVMAFVSILPSGIK